MQSHLALSLTRLDQHSSEIQDLERWTSLAAAAAAITYGFTRRTVPGLCMAIAATPLVYKGLVGKWPFENGADDTHTALSGNRGIHVRESVRLERPVHEVYGFWRRLENLPRFMSHLEQVTELATAARIGSPGGRRPAGRVGRRDHQRGREQGHRLAFASGFGRRDGRLGELLDRTRRT